MKRQKIKIEKARKNEYEYIQRFLENVYGHSRDFFWRNYPHVWLKENTDFENTLVIREKGKIVSLVRIFPLRFVFGRARLYAGGIGAVSTDPECRGHGYMSVLMNEAIRKMARDGYAVSALGGDRHRYNYFGYENAGQFLSLFVDTRGLEKAGIETLPVRRYAGEQAVLRDMARCYRAHNFRLERTPADFAALLQKLGTAVYHAGAGAKFAYAAIPQESRGSQVVEFGGDNRTLLGILKYLGGRFGGAASLGYPDFASIPPEIIKCSSGWGMNLCGMLKVINLRKALEAYRELLDETFPEGGAVTLQAPEATVCLKKEKGILHIGEGRVGDVLVLTEPELVRLLFGLAFCPPSATKPETGLLLKAIFPLPFFWWPLDHI